MAEPLPKDPELLRRLMAEACAFIDFAEPIAGRTRGVLRSYREFLDLDKLIEFREQIEEDLRQIDRDRHALRRAPLMLNLLRRHFTEEETAAILADRRRAEIRRRAYELGEDPIEVDRRFPPGNPMETLLRPVRRLQGEIAAMIEGVGATPGKGGRPPKNAERDAAIVAALRQGEKHAAIRARFNLTRDQLKGVVRRNRNLGSK